jgi:hypothetical protein
LEERYFSKKDLSEATYNHLKNNGHTCELLNVDTIIVNDSILNSTCMNLLMLALNVLVKYLVIYLIHVVINRK